MERALDQVKIAFESIETDKRQAEFTNEQEAAMQKQHQRRLDLISADFERAKEHKNASAARAKAKRDESNQKIRNENNEAKEQKEQKGQKGQQPSENQKQDQRQERYREARYQSWKSVAAHEIIERDILLKKINTAFFQTQKRLKDIQCEKGYKAIFPGCAS